VAHLSGDELLREAALTAARGVNAGSAAIDHGENSKLLQRWLRRGLNAIHRHLDLRFERIFDFL